MNSATSRSWMFDDLAGNAGIKPRLYRAPGRVNIIGEHTDYTEGLVLPTTTATYTWIAASARDDRTINIRSLNLDDTQSFHLDDAEINAEPAWIAYAKGVTALLERKGIQLTGADLVIDSEIPMGGGLSSSAALEVGIATALLDLTQNSMPPAEMAALCQRAEIEYAGVNCGIMDQFAIACCRRGDAMLLDCRSLEATYVRLPTDIRLLLTDSGVKRALPEGDYNQRTDECADATELLVARIEGLKSLRDLKPKDLDQNRDTLGDRLYRRCRHVVGENQRVMDAYSALKSGDSSVLGSLINASHHSLRDDFAVSCGAVDTLVDIANDCDGVLGSRMVGAGFGGCVLSVVEVDKIGTVTEQIRRHYESVSGNSPWMHVVSETDPAQRVSPE